jgi:hypothetical protein
VPVDLRVRSNEEVIWITRGLFIPLLLDCVKNTIKYEPGCDPNGLPLWDGKIPYTDAELSDYHKVMHWFKNDADYLMISLLVSAYRHAEAAEKLIGVKKLIGMDPWTAGEIAQVWVFGGVPMAEHQLSSGGQLKEYYNEAYPKKIEYRKVY